MHLMRMKILLKWKMRLYDGAHVMIGEDVVLAFHTENGQTGQMQSEDNPLSVTYTLQPEKKYTVGKEIPAGCV